MAIIRNGYYTIEEALLRAFFDMAWRYSLKLPRFETFIRSRGRTMTTLSSSISSAYGNYAASMASKSAKTGVFQYSSQSFGGNQPATAEFKDSFDVSNAGLRLSLSQWLQGAKRTDLKLNYYENVRNMGVTDEQRVVTDRYIENMSGNGFLPGSSRSGVIRLNDETVTATSFSNANLEDQLLSEKINIVVKKAGIRLEKNEKLDFTVDQDGYISVGEGIEDKDKRAQIEQALNNGNLGQDLLISQARYLNTQEDSTSQDRAIANRILTDATLGKHFGLSVEDFSVSHWNDQSMEWTNGLSIRCTAEGKEGLEKEIYCDSLSLYSGIEAQLYDHPGKTDSFQLEMCFVNGMLVRGEEAEEMPGIFNNRGDSFESLSKLIGLEEEVDNIEDFAIALDELITEEQDALNTEIGKLLKLAGLGDETRKITFAEDESGNIVIEGNIRKDQKKEFELLVNGDKELVERIKTHKARQEVFDGLADKVENERGELEIVAKNSFDLGTEELTAARKQLLKDYLGKQEIDFNQLGLTQDENGNDRIAMFDADGLEIESELLQGLLNEFWDLEDELVNTFNRDAKQAVDLSVSSTAQAIELGASEPVVETRGLLSTHRGELTVATDEEPLDFTDQVNDIRKGVAAWVKYYNEELAKFDPDMEITNFSIRIDDEGKMVIENVQTKGGDREQTAEAKAFLMRNARSNQEAFAEAVMSQHDEEHGDVEEYKHYMIISDEVGDEMQILSPDADKAALAEIAQLSVEISAEFGDFFKSIGINDSFSIFWDAENGLSLDGAFVKTASGRSVETLLARMNERLKSDDPFNDDLFDSTIPEVLNKTMEKLLALEHAYGKLHDPNLKNLGVEFKIN